MGWLGLALLVVGAMPHSGREPGEPRYDWNDWLLIGFGLGLLTAAGLSGTSG